MKTQHSFFCLVFMLLFTASTVNAQEIISFDNATKAFNDLRAYNKARKNAMPLLKSTRAMLWMCGNCPQRSEIINMQHDLLNDRDAILLGTYMAGIRTSPSDSAARRFLYSSPYGDVSPKCRSKFYHWAECVRRTGGFGYDKCLTEFEPVKQCRINVELYEGLPSYAPDSLMGRLAIHISGVRDFSSLLLYERIYDATHKVTRMVNAYGSEVMDTAAREMLKNNRRDIDNYIQKFVKKPQTEPNKPTQPDTTPVVKQNETAHNRPLLSTKPNTGSSAIPYTGKWEGELTCSLEGRNFNVILDLAGDPKRATFAFYRDGTPQQGGKLKMDRTQPGNSLYLSSVKEKDWIKPYKNTRLLKILLVPKGQSALWGKVRGLVGCNRLVLNKVE